MALRMGERDMSVVSLAYGQHLLISAIKHLDNGSEPFSPDCDKADYDAIEIMTDLLPHGTCGWLARDREAVWSCES